MSKMRRAVPIISAAIDTCARSRHAANASGSIGCGATSRSTPSNWNARREKSTVDDEAQPIARRRRCRRPRRVGPGPTIGDAARRGRLRARTGSSGRRRTRPCRSCRRRRRRATCTARSRGTARARPRSRSARGTGTGRSRGRRRAPCTRAGGATAARTPAGSSMCARTSAGGHSRSSSLAAVSRRSCWSSVREKSIGASGSSGARGRAGR